MQTEQQQTNAVKMTVVKNNGMWVPEIVGQFQTPGCVNEGGIFARGFFLYSGPFYGKPNIHASPIVEMDGREIDLATVILRLMRRVRKNESRAKFDSIFEKVE